MSNWFEPDSLKDLIREACLAHPKLQKIRYRDKDEYPNPFSGYCYIASEAYYHLAPEHTLVPAYIYTGEECDDTHWFLFDPTGLADAEERYLRGQLTEEPVLEDYILDLTAEQFQEGTLSYEGLVRCGFLTKQPSKRTQTLIDWVMQAI